MKKILIFFLSCLFMALATPHYSGGIPNIGPLEGQITFWGGKDTGEYFDGVEYGYSNKIADKKYGDIKLSISYTHYLNSVKKNKEDKKRVHLTFEKPIDNITGEMKIKILNSNGKSIERIYKGTVNNKKEIIYNSFFDFSGINEKSKVTMEFLLVDGKKIPVKINGQILKDLISLSEYFPETENIKK